MITETRKALDNAGFADVLVAGMDETILKKTAKQSWKSYRRGKDCTRQS